MEDILSQENRYEIPELLGTEVVTEDSHEKKSYTEELKSDVCYSEVLRERKKKRNKKREEKVEEVI